jgi:hypothetical protein
MVNRPDWGLRVQLDNGPKVVGRLIFDQASSLINEANP